MDKLNLINALKFIVIMFISGYQITSLAALEYVITGVNSEAKANIAIFLKQLNSPQDANNSAYLKQVTDSAKDALNALGYYQVKMETQVTEKQGKQQVSVIVQSAQQTYITKVDLRIIGEGKSDLRFQQLEKQFPLKVGQAFNHGQYESAKDQIKSLAQQRGYFDAKYERSSVQVSTKKQSADITLWFNTGVRYQFGDLEFPSPLASEKYIRSLMTFTEGDPFNFTKLRSFNVAVNKTGFYKNITVIPQLERKKGLAVPLRVEAIMAPEDSFSVGGGYSTDDGINGKFGWSRPWINSQGHSIEADLSVSNYEQAYSLTYKIPIGDPLYEYASIQGGYQRVDQNDTDTKEYVLTLGRHRKSVDNWLYNIFLKYDYEVGTQGTQYYNDYLLMPGISINKVVSQGGINATKGLSRVGTLTTSSRVWFSDSDFIKVYGKTKFIQTYKKHQLVGSAELGAIIGTSIDDLPSSVRFFTGGDQSIRGFSYETIAPEDDDGYLQGGLYLTVASLEYRYAITNTWKVALFADAGTATNDFSETLSRSTGVGVVWSSPIGPIRFYVAKPLTDSDDSFGFNFMIGPEL